MKSLYAGLAVLLAAVSPARAENPLIHNVVDCKPDFFDLVKKERAAIGPVTIRIVEDEHFRITSAMFAKPIHDFGLTFIGYRQEGNARRDAPAGDAEDSVKWRRWGFVVNASPRAVAFALDGYVKKRGLTSEGLRFSKDKGDGWRVGIGPYMGKTRWRQLKVASIDEGKTSFLFCELDSYAKKPVNGKTFDGLPPNVESLFDIRRDAGSKP